MQKGFILPGIIVLSTLITAAALQWSMQLHGQYRRGEAEYLRVQLMHTAKSAADIAGNSLLDIESLARLLQTNTMKINLGDTSCSIIVDDELGRLNINQLLYPSGEIRTELADVFFRMAPEHISKNEFLNFLAKNQKKYGAASYTPGMIRLFEPFKNTHWCFDLLTTYGDGRININTASRSVLEAIPADNGDDFASGIIKLRSRKLIRSAHQIRDELLLDQSEFTKLFKLIRTDTDTVRLNAEAQRGDISAHCEIIVRVTGRKMVVLMSREWWS